MPLDSLGLGLTLDTTLLAKADKTLENMAKNSKLVMQNLTRGITAFNEGKIADFTQVLGHMSSALDKLSKTEVSPDFDTTGQDKFIDRMQHIMSMMEKMSKIKGAKFYDPTEVYVTDKDATDIFGEMQALQEYKKELAELVNIIKNYGPIQQGLKEEMGKLGGEITEQEKEVKALSLAYDEAKKKQEAALKAMATQFKAFSTRERKKDSSLTDEQLLGMFASKVSMQKYVEEVTKANEELVKAEEKLMESTEKLEGYQSRLNATQQEYKSNIGIKQREDEIKASYDLIKEQEKILQAEMKYAQATEAERAAMLTKRNEAEIKADQKRVREKQKEYENLRKAIQKGEKEIADLEASRATLKEAGRSTKGIDAEIKKRRDELNALMKDELEFRSSQYWPKLQAIDEKFNSEAFVKNQKALAKLAAKESRKDVTSAIQYSRNAQTINEEKEAIKRLVEARDNLSTSTARYKKTVEDINKRILAHKDHIEAVTRVEKEQNTLADSVINRYRKQLKALDDVDEALDKIAKKQQSTGQPYNQEEARARIDLVKRRDTIEKDILDIESRAQGELDVIKEQHEAERAKKRIDEIIRQNEREKQEYAKLLDDLYALEKQKKSMEDAGGGVGDVAYDKLLQQEADLQARKAQLESQHQNDLDEIRKKHDKRRNDDEVKAFIDAQKEKQRIAEEYAKKQREKAKKYGTISNASAERLIGVADKAQNVNQHKLAIEKLTQARNSLNTTDKDYLKTVKKLNDAIKYHEIEIELVEDKSKKLMQTHRGLMDIGGQLMRRLALAFSVSQLTQYFRKLVEVRGEFEKTEVALTTILKSRAQANVLMNQITDLAVKSPFTLQQLVGYTKQLAAYQIEYKKLYSTTKMLADVSAGLGVEMDRLILAFGQVRAANFLRATEVRQFTEAGFDILGELAKHYSTLKGEMVSVAEVQEMVTKRMVGFSDVEKVFQNVTSAGGIFYDMQAKQAETLAGQWSNLQDKISIMYNEIGKSTDGMLKGIVSFLASLIDNWEGAATVLKGVVTAFAMVKINAALTSKETIKFVRSMGLIKGRVKAVKVIQLLGAAFVKLGRSIKAAGVALKAFAVNNPYAAALLALVGVIGAVVSKHRKQEEAVKEVIERYDQLHESITDINAAMLNAINEQDLDKQKEALKELVDMVDKEYNMTVNIDIENLNPEEIAQKFNEIMDEAEKLNIFGELFGSGLEGFKASGMLTDNLLKDVSQYGEAANGLFKQMVDKSNMVASALQEIDAEKYKDIIKDLVAPRDIRGGESELAYLNRLYEAYMKIKEESSIDLTWDEDTDQYIARTSDNFYELGKILGKIDFNSLSLDYANALKEFKDVEFINYLDTLTDSLTGLTDEQKEKKLKFAIDTEAAHREWNAFVVQLMYEIANQKFNLNIKPTIEAPDEVKWKEWQENYKKKFENEEGYMRITSPSITQEAQIKALNEEYAKQYDLLERIKKAGGSSALEVGGAYEGLGKTMEEITAEMEDVNAQIEYLGGKNTTIDKNEKASQKILNRRISILKEIHEAYNQARKDDLGHEEAVQKVMKDWGDTFKEAFEGTSMSLANFDFSTPEGLVKALRGLIPIAQKEGKEAMLALSKEISKVENEVGVKIRLENVDEFKVDIEKTLGDYKLWKDIEKLRMPDDVASKIFGVTPKTLQQVREEVLKALNLGDEINLGNEEDVLAAVKLLYGDPTEEVVRNFFKNVNQIQRNETEEQAKRFVKFLTKNLDQTKVIMSQRGIDIAFAKEQFDKGAISAEQFAETVKNIVAQSNEEISKFNLDKFKESAEYIQAMGDLSSYSKKEIQALIKTLNDAVTQNAHLFDADEVKAYMDALKKAQEEIESRDVFKWGDFERAADIIQTQRDIEDKKADIETNKAELETQKQKLAELQAKLDNLKAQQKATKDASGDTTQVDADIAKTTSDIVAANEDIGKTNNEIKTNTGLLSLLGDKMKGLAGNMGNTLAIIDAIVHGINDTVQGINTIYGEIGSVMESFGKETDFSTGFGKGAMLMDTFAKSSQAAADGWDAFKSGDPVGVVVNVVKSITEIIKGINAYHDAGLEVIIQDHLEEVERLQKEYEKLEWVIGRALAFDKYGMVSEQTKNLGKQIENTSKAIALEEDKKDTDEERIKELRENAEQARRQIQELYDNLREEIVGSYEDLSSTLADAMIEALKSGEDALKAWSDSVDEMIENIVTKLAVQKYVEPQVSKVLDQFYNKTMPRNAAAEKAFNRLQNMTAGTEEYNRALAQYEKLNEQAIGELPKITEESLNALKASLDAIGVSFEPIAEQIVGLFGQEGGLSGLQKGISGMSEQQAEILTAYWNSVRGYTASIDSKMDLILANLNVSAEDNPMLAQLMMVARNTSAINTLLSSLVKSGHTLGGSGIKVFMS